MTFVVYRSFITIAKLPPKFPHDYKSTLKFQHNIIPESFYIKLFTFHPCPTGLGSFSDWVKSKTRGTETSDDAPSPTSDPAPSEGYVYSPSKDRLLHSEIRELQMKVSSLEKENHELRLHLGKQAGVDPNTFLTGRKVQPVTLKLGTRILALS